MTADTDISENKVWRLVCDESICSLYQYCVQLNLFENCLAIYNEIHQ
jgi:hypothetical protein